MKCQHPGCTGTIVDGYCDVCGLAPATAPPHGAPLPPPRPGTSLPAPPGGGYPPPPPRRPVAPSEGAASAPATSGGSALSGSGGSGGRRGTTRTRASTRSHLGAGLVDIPPIPTRDPSTAVLANPELPEDKRFCGHCGDPVGRGRDGKPGRPEGFCRRCGHPYSFVPKLTKGDLVAGQYEILGCLAHGGLGWIYLARDRHVSDRWVVLKGLLDTGDEDANAAALAERRFLAQVEHPSIVKIFNFVDHQGASYIVMEFVGGESLKDLLKQRRAAAGHADPLPPEQALAYVLEILPAFAYLHRLDLLYCDFKPDNIIQSGDLLKLIDLGGVHRVDDTTSAVYGTVGYQAPEIADVGPSISSDLFTVARTLAVLCLDFKGYQQRYLASLPGPEDAPLFAEFDSLYRFLLKGAAADPAARFQSADEMADQLLGVLREVVAAKTGIPRPAISEQFTSDLRGQPDTPDWRLLPTWVVAADDPAASFLATLAAAPVRDQIDSLRNAQTHGLVQSEELDFRLARCLIDVGGYGDSDAILTRLEVDNPADWRLWWLRGLSALDRKDTTAAWAAFFRVYAELPGELAPKLALAVTAELAKDPARAARWYDIVSATDPSFTTASFGLARCRLAGGDRLGAVEAYNRVPEVSSSYLDAQLCAARALIEVNGATPPQLADLARADAALGHLTLSSEQRAGVTRDLLESALQLLRTKAIHPDATILVGGVPVTEARLRLGLEKAYRTLARLSPSAEERIRLVDKANQTRPRTLW
ncbi:MAG: tetratricopeptide repeat protein [Acidimicrobiales bacterium]